MNKSAAVFLGIAVIAAIFGAYQWQRAEATEKYGFEYVQHAIDVIDASKIPDATKDELIKDLTEGAPKFEGALISFSNSKASWDTDYNMFMGNRRFIRAANR